MRAMPALVQTVGLLFLSNCFMTAAWESLQPRHVVSFGLILAAVAVAFR